MFRQASAAFCEQDHLSWPARAELHLGVLLNYKLREHSREPLVAILEGIWMPAHEGGQLSPTEIARRVNAILRSRGVTDSYNAREIGWKLRDLGLYTSKNGRGKILKLTDEVGARVHRLALDFRTAVTCGAGMSPLCGARSG